VGNKKWAKLSPEISNVALGQFNDVRKRQSLIDSANFDYMSSLMKRDMESSPGEHVSFMKRDLPSGEHTSPL